MEWSVAPLQSGKTTFRQIAGLGKLLIFPTRQNGQKVVPDCLESTSYHSGKPIYIDRGNVPDCSPARPRKGYGP